MSEELYRNEQDQPVDQNNDDEKKAEAGQERLRQTEQPVQAEGSARAEESAQTEQTRRTEQPDQSVGVNNGEMTKTEPGQERVERSNRPVKKKKKLKKKGSRSGKKWASLIAGALVFGLVAGGTMVGVNAIGGYFLGTKNSGSASQQVGLTRTAADSESTGDVVSSDSTGDTQTVAQVVEEAMPSLVTISTMSVEEMRSFFGGTQQYEVEGAGSGVIVGQNDTELLIATNYHVVEGAESVSVGFVDEASVEAQIKGTDINNDLAVVSVKLSDIPEDTMSQIKIATVGDSDELNLGDQVVAIGNALGYGQSVTSGYVSALDRDLTLTYNSGTTIQSTGLIQTDAAINSGNSGGALLNMKGELIGINEAKSSSSSSGASVDNVGFAIPIDKAAESLQEMMNMETREKVDESQASYLGIRGSDVSSDMTEIYGMPSGAAVSMVVENGPAEEAGIKQGDIITALDGRTITSMSQLQDTLQYYAAGETVEVTIQRADNGEYQEQTLSVTLGSAQDMPRN